MSKTSEVRSDLFYGQQSPFDPCEPEDMRGLRIAGAVLSKMHKEYLSTFLKRESGSRVGFAHKTIKEFLRWKGNNRLTSLAEFSSGAVFDPDRFEAGTIIRSQYDVWNHGREFAFLDRKMRGDYKEREPVGSEFRRYGVIVNNGDNKALVQFFMTEEELRKYDFAPHEILGGPIKTGEWNHSVTLFDMEVGRGFILRPGNMRYDTFTRFGSIDVISVGKAVVEGRRVSAGDPRLSRILQPSRGHAFAG